VLDLLPKAQHDSGRRVLVELLGSVSVMGVVAVLVGVR
jgi:hypothetical protein